MKKRQHFDVNKAIEDAWEFCWACQLKKQKENAVQLKRTGRAGYRDDSAYWLTASDIENQVRRFAVEQMNGVARGSTGLAWGHEPGYLDGGGQLRMPGGLLGRCRTWLLRNQNIQSHNFGRGHISGMRFRPVGVPLTATEQATLQKHRKIDEKIKAGLPTKPWHYGERWGSRPLCMKKQMKGRLSFRRSKALVTPDKMKITCPRCLRLIAACEAVA